MLKPLAANPKESRWQRDNACKSLSDLEVSIQFIGRIWNPPFKIQFRPRFILLCKSHPNMNQPGVTTDYPDSGRCVCVCLSVSAFPHLYAIHSSNILKTDAPRRNVKQMDPASQLTQTAIAKAKKSLMSSWQQRSQTGSVCSNFLGNNCRIVGWESTMTWLDTWCDSWMHHNHHIPLSYYLPGSAPWGRFRMSSLPGANWIASRKQPTFQTGMWGIVNPQNMTLQAAISVQIRPQILMSHISPVSHLHDHISSVTDLQQQLSV